MKKFFEVFAIIATIVVVFFVGGGLFLISQLPSANKISKVLKGDSPKQAEPLKATSEGNAQVSESSEQQNPKDFQQGEKTYVVSSEDKMKQAAMIDDLKSSQKPMSSFCSSLKNSKQGAMSGDEFTKNFMNTNSPDSADPRIEAMKPLFRYVFRLPKMQELVQAVETADLKGDEDNLFEKAQFYGKALAAYTEMKEHRTDMEAVMDRGYLFLGLNNLVAKQPHLIASAAVQKYCGAIEKSFNDLVPVDFDSEKKEFLNLVQELGFQPQDVKFDLNYRSEMDFSFGQNQLTFKGGWLEDLIKVDPPTVSSSN